MKRLLAALCALMVIWAVNPLLGLPEPGETEMTGADMAAEVPQGWKVLTRDAEVLESNAATFDMTRSEALDFLRQNDFYLVLYEPETGAELYVTVFPSAELPDLSALGELDAQEMENVRQSIAEGYQGWVMDSGVTELDAGEHTFLAATMHRDEGEERIDNRQLFTVWNGQEIYIDLYVSGGMDERLVEVQNDLARSLRCGLAAQRQERARQLRLGYAGALVGVLLLLLVQFVGLAMAIFLATRKDED